MLPSSQTDVPRLIALIEAGRLDVGSMVSRRLTLDQVNEGLTAMEKGEVIRSVIVGSGCRVRSRNSESSSSAMA